MKVKKIDIKSYSTEELKLLFSRLNEKSFRGEQLFHSIHKNLIDTFEDITVFPKNLRNQLSEKYYIRNVKLLHRFDSGIDVTKKYLLLLSDKNIIESVLMRYQHGYSQCLSTQVGCRMGCSFCASTKGGLIRNLTSSEMLDQVYQVQKDMNIKVSNIVLMGIGEPLDNYDNVIKFLKLIHSKKGQNFGFRHITLSTVGIPEKIVQLANESIPITLSISLHSAFDDKRRKIVPLATKYSIKVILQACRNYLKSTNRRISFEYAMIKGLNDSREDAEKLASILTDILTHVNLICLNPIKETKYKTSSMKSIKKFQSILHKKGVEATIRRKMGTDINAACGQLRNDYLKNRSKQY